VVGIFAYPFLMGWRFVGLHLGEVKEGLSKCCSGGHEG
jgi:hypothetical protein